LEPAAAARFETPSLFVQASHDRQRHLSQPQLSEEVELDQEVDLQEEQQQKEVGLGDPGERCDNSRKGAW